jgi:hypothetical protein
MIPSPDLRLRVLAAIEREPAPSRRESTTRTAIAFTLGFLPIVLFVGVLGVTPGERPLGYVAMVGVGWALLAAASTWGALGRGRSMLGRPRAWLIGIALLLPIALLGVASAGYVPWPNAMAIDCDRFRDIVCFDFASAMSLGPLIAFAIARRGTDPLHPALTGAALGGASGAWGAVAIALHCPISSLAHVALGHVLPVVLFATVGAVVGARVVAVRARTK